MSSQQKPLTFVCNFLRYRQHQQTIDSSLSKQHSCSRGCKRCNFLKSKDNNLTTEGTPLWIFKVAERIWWLWISDTLIKKKKKTKKWLILHNGKQKKRVWGKKKSTKNGPLLNCFILSFWNSSTLEQLRNVACKDYYNFFALIEALKCYLHLFSRLMHHLWSTSDALNI